MIVMNYSQNFDKDLCTDPRARGVNAFTCDKMCMCMFMSCTHMLRARILPKDLIMDDY